MWPRLSVIIPAYRCASYLGAALESVWAQVITEQLEVIVVDDSPEEHRAIIQRYAGRIQYVRRDRPEGVSAARNAGMKAAQSELIAFLDADDLWLPQKIKRQLAILEQYQEAGLTFSTIEEIGEDHLRQPLAADSAIPSPLDKWCYQFATGDSEVALGPIYSPLLHNNFIPTCSVVLRRECLDRVGTFDPRYPICEDYDLWLRIARAYPVAFLNRVTAQYRVRADGLSGSSRERIFRWKEWNARVLADHWPHIPAGERAWVRGKIATRFREAAWHHLREGRTAKARELFACSLRHDRWSASSLTGLAASAWRRKTAAA